MGVCVRSHATVGIVTEAVSLAVVKLNLWTPRVDFSPPERDQRGESQENLHPIGIVGFG